MIYLRLFLNPKTLVYSWRWEFCGNFSKWKLGAKSRLATVEKAKEEGIRILGD